MQATITVTMDNDAFGDYPELELARILHVLANRISLNQRAAPGTFLPLHDENGNRVGHFEVSGEE